MNTNKDRLLNKVRIDYNLGMKNIAIILAGGLGARFKGREPKQFLKLGKKTLLEICLGRFQNHRGICEIVLVCPKTHLARAKKLASAFPKVAQVLAGGKTRQESSAKGVQALPAGVERVLIHDAARPLVSPGVIGRVLAALASASAVMPVLALGDTTVRVGDNGAVLAVLDREKLRRVQTPQGFRADVMRRAHEMARAEGFTGAGDDCSLVLRYGLAPVVAVAGDPDNIKITFPQDLSIADSILRNQRNK